MGHTNATPNYNFPQFVGTDKPTFLGDINGAFLAIDGAIAGAQADADGAASVANTAASTAAGAVETANSAATTAASAASTATAAQSTANTAADTANNAQSTAVLAKSTADSAAADAAEAKAAAVRGSVTVTADGVKTWAALLAELYAEIDASKISPNAVLYRSDDNFYCPLARIEAGGALHFGTIMNYDVHARAYLFEVFSTNSKYIVTAIENSGNTNTNNSANVPANGTIIKLYY